MRLDEPVDLLRELEELSALDFKVRHTAPDNLILDVDEDQGPSSTPPRPDSAALSVNSDADLGL